MMILGAICVKRDNRRPATMSCVAVWGEAGNHSFLPEKTLCDTSAEHRRHRHRWRVGRCLTRLMINSGDRIICGSLED